MQDFLWGLRVGAWSAGGLLLVFVIIGAVYLLAKNNIFFTFVEEGTAKVTMMFNAFYRIVMQYQNCTCKKEDDWEVILPPKRPRRRLLGGLHLVGIPGIFSVYSYNFRWATVKPQREPGEQVERREERISHIFVKDYVYLAEIYGAETKGLVPLDISFLVTARVVNPYKALFRVHDWVNVIVARIEAYFRQYVALTEYQEIIGKKQQMGGEIMKALGETGMLEHEPDPKVPNDTHRKGIFWEDYGVKVKNIEMREITPSGENKKAIQEAATRKWVAEREAERILTLADAERQRVDIVYSAVRGHGEEGLRIRTLESIDNAGAKQGNWVLALPGQIQRLFEGRRKDD